MARLDSELERMAVVVGGDTIELHVGDKAIAVRLCGIDSLTS
jgi:endonuclease YncB( thermonuclease family)